MNRRTHLKNLLAGVAGAALVSQATGCEQPLPEAGAVEAEAAGYGLRFPHELKHDARIANDNFFTEAEKADLTILTDIIAPGDEESPSASDCEVVDFIEFMALDQPDNFQNSLRGGLAWTNSEAQHRYGKPLAELDAAQRIAIVDDIAYPQQAKGTPMEPGANFFDQLRFLTLTGYFTSRKGLRDLDYRGNRANVWDGVPQEVLDKHGLAYDPKYLPLYVNNETRDEVVQWGDDMRPTN